MKYKIESMRVDYGMILRVTDDAGRCYLTTNDATQARLELSRLNAEVASGAAAPEKSKPAPSFFNLIIGIFSRARGLGPR
ncbi:MAG: hypothetical protein LBL46_04340 [Rickettsiales bacterium]|jgi:hypothetical protein|nr:hypothetical protein [Rickettsiales bacterium]